MKHEAPSTTIVQPLTLDHALALQAGSRTFMETFDLSVAEGYLAFPEALPHMIAALQDGMAPRWFSYLIIDQQHEIVVGLGGFTGPPEGGTVEIGYSVAPDARGQGHATRAVRAWLEIAREHGVQSVLAHTLPEGNASTAVLRRCGFQFLTQVSDPQEGTTWRWQRNLTEVDASGQ